MMIGEEALWNAGFWATIFVSIGTHAKASDLGLRVRPSEIMMLGRAVNFCICTLLLGDLFSPVHCIHQVDAAIPPKSDL